MSSYLQPTGYIRTIHEIIHENCLIDNISGFGRGVYLTGTPNKLVNINYNHNLIFVL